MEFNAMSTEETSNNYGVQCPFCGHVNRDSRELGDGGEGCGETECGKCEKPFLWIRRISVTYYGRELKKSCNTETELE